MVSLEAGFTAASSSGGNVPPVAGGIFYLLKTQTLKKIKQLW